MTTAVDAGLVGDDCAALVHQGNVHGYRLADGGELVVRRGETTRLGAKLRGRVGFACADGGCATKAQVVIPSGAAFRCFNWVQFEDSGDECHRSLAACRQAAASHANSTPCDAHSGAAYSAQVSAQVGRDPRCYASPWSCYRHTGYKIGEGCERTDR